MPESKNAVCADNADKTLILSGLPIVSTVSTVSILPALEEPNVLIACFIPRVLTHNPLLLEAHLHLLQPPPDPGSIFRKVAVVLQAVMVIPIPQA